MIFYNNEMTQINAFYITSSFGCNNFFKVGVNDNDDQIVGQAMCLAACEDQVNLVTETSSSFPNSETFHRREEFCLVSTIIIII